MANVCFEDGLVVGAKQVLPDDPSLYSWPGFDCGCNHLVCSACGKTVHADAGWDWDGKQKPDNEALFGGAAPSAIAGLAASEDARLYRCACAAHVEREVASMERYRGDSVRSSVGMKWGCGGHAPLVLPATIASVLVDPAHGNARQWLTQAIAAGTDYFNVAARVAELYFRLRETAVEPQITMAIAALVNDDELRLRDAALGFYNLASFVPGAERIGILAAEQPSLFAGELPIRLKSRYLLALLVATRAVKAGRPDDPPVQELLRREALTEQYAPYLYDFLAEHDDAWVVAHAHEFPANVADKVNELVKFRGAAAPA